MKISKITIFAVLCVVFAVFTSCKNNGGDPEPTYSGTIKLDGVTYNVASAAILTLSTPDGVRSNVNLTSTTESGKAINVQLALSYPSNEQISGTYPLGDSFDDARCLDSWMTNYAVISGMASMESYNDLVSGTATIADKGNNKFDISFKFKPRAGSEIEGTYSGSVTRSTQSF